MMAKGKQGGSEELAMAMAMKVSSQAGRQVERGNQ